MNTDMEAVVPFGVSYCFGADEVSIVTSAPWIATGSVSPAFRMAVTFSRQLTAANGDTTHVFIELKHAARKLFKPTGHRKVFACSHQTRRKGWQVIGDLGEYRTLPEALAAVTAHLDAFKAGGRA